MAHTVFMNCNQGKQPHISTLVVWNLSFKYLLIWVCVFVYVHASILTFPNLPTDMLMAASHPPATSYLLRWQPSRCYSHAPYKLQAGQDHQTKQETFPTIY